MTFEEYIKNTNDIRKLKQEFIEYHKFTLGFEAFMIEKLGKKQYDELCTEYATLRANTWLKEALEVNKA